MRVPLGWLREFTALPESASPDELHAALVRVGFEEEAVHAASVTGPLVVGRVLDFVPEPQKNGKTIRWCRVQVAPDGTTAADDGDAVHGIVCGASNFEVGDLVVVTLPGAVLPGPFPIAARKTYGHVSDGMMASARELGLSDEHDGIIRLAELGIEAPVGADAIALLGLDESAIEINVTPDRGYALSIRGLAREYAASTGTAFTDPATAVVVDRATTHGGHPVTIDDAAPIRGRIGCSGFTARIVRGIDPVASTPSWMRTRLRLAGIRSISLPVDITNYVMVELGQPTHAYDLATLEGDALGVRRARQGERITTLDGQDRVLDAEDLLIVDGSGPIGIAGVMGGAATEVTVATTDVLVEAATFDPVSIGRSARRHRLPSEASRRFERGVDPAVAPVAAQRVVDLLVALAGGTADAAGTRIDTSTPPAPITLDGRAVSGRTGVAVPLAEQRTALEAIGATVTDAPGGLTVTPPTWRPDMTEAVDVIEEVVRIAGYDRIPSVLPVAPPGRGLTDAQQQRRRLSAALAAAGGVEVQSYPFVSPAAHARFQPDAPAVRLVNPIDGQAPLLRGSLLPGLLDAVRRNRGRGLADLALFELGSVFHPAAGVAYGYGELPPIGVQPPKPVLDALLGGLPPQPVHVAAVFAGDQVRKQPGRAAEPTDWTDAMAAALLAGAAVGATVRPVQAERAGFHPGRTARLDVATPDGPVTVGWAGELLPEVAAEIPGRVAALEIDVDALLAAAPRAATPAPLSSYPAATQDVSLVVDAHVPAADVRDAFVGGAGDLLEHAELVDDYRGQGVPDGAKSLTFALRFRAPDRTLTAAEATAAKDAGVAAAAALGARLRD